MPDNIFQRWKRCYTGPGKFLFAVTGADKLYAFTDHSFFIFLSDGTPYESVLLDGPACDAGKLAICHIYNDLFIYDAVYCMGKLLLADGTGKIVTLNCD